jgi:phospholipase C
MIVFENTTVDGVLAQPYFAKFAKDGAFLTESYGVARPSQPNYLAMIGGSLFGVASNRNVDINAKHLGDLLEEKGKTWKVYAEGYPGKCNLSSSVGTYDRKHNPFISFINVSKQSKRCANIVNSSELKKDIANNTMADFSFYIPDSNNSGHDTGIAFADKYFQKTFEPIFSDGNFNKEMTVIVTFDEGGKSSQHIYTAISGYQVQPGTTYSQTITHYGLLRTLEEGFRLDTLGKEDQKAKPATGIWK